MENLTITKPAQSYLLAITDQPGGKDILRIATDGTFYVYGEVTEDSEKIGEALKQWHASWKQQQNPTQ